MKTVFRADATPEIGAGHISRCLTLANVLRSRGYECIFAVGCDSLDTVPALGEFGFSILLVDDVTSTTFLDGMTADLLVVDHYGLDISFERRCRAQANSILVIDDLANRTHDCDYLLDVTPGRTHEDYAPLVPPDTVLLLGPQYALLGLEFSLYRGAALHRRRSSRKIETIVVALGMTDPGDITTLACEAISDLADHPNATIVLGPTAPAFDRVARAVNGQTAMRLVEGTQDMAGLLSSADLAIGAGGVSAFERCCLGLPTIMICAADNQRANAQGLADYGAVEYLGESRGVDAGTLAATMLKLISDSATRREMALAAARVCDGRGAARVAAALTPPHARDGGVVLLRPAESADRQIIFEWQQVPETRQYARTSGAPNWDQHCDWFSHKTSDPNCLFNVILHDDRPAGILRLEPTIPPGTRPAYEVSILVAPERKRLGIGAQALNLARDLVPEADIVAEILPENKASRSLFLKVGYYAITDTLFVKSDDYDADTSQMLNRQPGVLAEN